MNKVEIQINKQCPIEFVKYLIQPNHWKPFVNLVMKSNRRCRNPGCANDIRPKHVIIFDNKLQKTHIVLKRDIKMLFPNRILGIRDNTSLRNGDTMVVGDGPNEHNGDIGIIGDAN